jgi:hypothetical protein
MKRTFYSGLVVMCVLLAGFTLLVVSRPAAGPVSQTATPRAVQPTAPATKPIYERDFGTVPNPIASTWQGTTLLGMIGEQRPEPVIRLTARDQAFGDQVRITVDLTEQTITRRKVSPDGHGSSEVWKGHVLYRLQSAASGDGSFNHTPDGMMMGTRTTF